MAGTGVSRLNDRQEAFCNEYLIDLNATQSAIRAGYSKATAHAIAHKLLKKADIRQRLDELRSELLAAKAMTPGKVLDEWRKLATFDVRKLYHGDGTPRAIHDLDDDTAAAIVGLDCVMVGNEDRGVGQVLKYKLASKQAALDSIAKHFGMFVDRTEHSGPGGGPIQIAGDPDEMARRLAFFLSRVAEKETPPKLEFPE
jgi:phage terminase small subunit